MINETNHQRILRKEVEKLEIKAKVILDIIQNRLPEAASNLYVKTQLIDHLETIPHPVDRLMEFRILAGKLSIDIQDTINMVDNVKRISGELSDRARELLKLAAWTPEEVERAEKEGGL